MKYLSLFLVLFFASHCAYAQPCNSGKSSTTLRFNDVRFTLYNSGVQFYNKKKQTAEYFVPADSNTRTIYASSFWTSAFADTGAGNTLLTAAGFYNISGPGNDYFPGPLKADGTSDASLCGLFDTILTVKASQVDFHKANYSKPGYQMAKEIANWPGSHPLINYQIAPYADLNKNNIYEPSLGEYPVIKGDEAAFFILNDNGNLHTQTGGEPLKITYHILFYYFNSNTAPLSQAVFMDVKMVNRNSIALKEVYFGLWSDMDIGFPQDDYIGSMYNEDAYYTYNGDAFDEGKNRDYPGYGANPPTQAVCFLDKKMNFTSTYTVLNPDQSSPFIPIEYYNSLHGFWRDGSPVLFGGNGHKSSLNMSYPEGAINENLHANYIYPGKSDAEGQSTDGIRNYGRAEDWSESTAGNTPGERSIIGSHGPFNLAVNQSIDFSIAYVYSRSLNDEVDPIDKLESDIKIVKSKYKAATGIGSYQANLSNSVLVSPNPSTKTIVVSGLVGEIRVLNTLGQELMRSSKTLSNERTIDISSLNKGLYYVSDEAGNVGSFVKN